MANKATDKAAGQRSAGTVGGKPAEAGGGPAVLAVTGKKSKWIWSQSRSSTEPSATCILNIALPTRDGCDKF